MLFSEVMQSLKPDGDCWSAAVPEDWMQGRSVFGGLQAAFALRAMRALVPADLPLRTLQATFMAPVPAGAVRVRAKVLRQGKSAVHVEARFEDGAQTLCLLMGVFGAGRISAVAIMPRQEPVENRKPLEFRHIPGVTPNFTRHFPSRWLRGGLPFTGHAQPEAVIEINMQDTGLVSEYHVLAIADFIPPVALSLLKTPSPGSSLTWMIEFLRERFDDLPLPGWRVDAQLIAASGGYTNQSVMVWGPGGIPVALSRQSMVVFG
jgi:acyl-CoA thioesterase